MTDPVTSAERAPSLRVNAIRLPVIVLAVISGSCLLAPLLPMLPAPIDGNVLAANQPWCAPGHPLGTDGNGNDVLSRLLHGGRSSLGIAVTVNLLGLTLGGLLGAIAARAGGMIDAVLMRAIDVLIALPSLVLAVAIAAALGPGHGTTITALTTFSVPAFARVARVATLRLEACPFITAAVLSGTNGMRLLLCHVAPNLLPHLGTFALLGMGVVILIEGALGFLGLGVPPPAPSWGNLIAHGQETLAARPALVLLPSTLLFVTVLCCNVLGEALRVRWSTG
ncbi:MAG: ABC transporter permease [Gammaproteobacteria bacterium]|nr:ABC transporter permease [Gammaproteobacteria bacterium]